MAKARENLNFAKILVHTFVCNENFSKFIVRGSKKFWATYIYYIDILQFYILYQHNMLKSVVNFSKYTKFNFAIVR